MTSSQILDLFSLIVVAWFTIKGASRGLVSQITWIAALILCFKFSSVLTPVVEPVIGVDPPLRRWISMAIVYIGLCLGVFMAAGMLKSWLQKAKLNDFDRHLGSVLGLSTGVVVCMTALFFLLTIRPSSLEMVRNSWSGRTAAFIIHQVDPLLQLTPEGAEDQVRAVLEKYQETLDPNAELRGGSTSDEEVFGEGDADEQGFDLSQWLGGSKSDTDTAAPPDNRTALEDLLNVLSPSTRNRFGASLLEAWSRASESDREELLSEITHTIPAQAGAVLDSFVTRHSPSREAQPGGAEQLSRQQEKLLKEIAEIYGPRRNVAERARQYLAGIPDAVQQAVLEDWYADVMILRNDPDPGTDVTATVDERILRQMRRLNLSLDQLDQAIRERLSQSRR